MAHHSLAQLFTQFGGKNASMPVDLDRVLRMYGQGLRKSIITAGASGAAVSLPAYVTGDQLLSVVSHAAGGITLTNHTDFSYSATFAIKEASNAASGLQCEVLWYDQDKFTYGS